MDKLIVISACEDGSCCCLPPRTTVTLISIFSLASALIEMAMSRDSRAPCCLLKDCVESMRTVLLAMFQLANVLLLMASVTESASLVGVYVCFGLGFVAMGLCFAIVELLSRLQHEGAPAFATFLSEVIFIFVISRCLPLVNDYKKQLELRI